MADDAGGGLLVQIGVTQARMERELAKLVKDAAKSANDMEKSFNAANNNVGKGAQAAFGNATRGATQATGAIKNTAGVTSNLAAQLNDIGVQLAGGQSPFLIMLQQGTQISQIFTSTGASVRGFGSILAGAVTSVLNPFSLLTFAIIAAGGTAVQYFMDLVSGGENANKTIEEQQKLITTLAEKWGEAVPALREYADAIKAAADEADAATAREALRARLVEDTAAQIENANVQAADLVSKLMAADSANPVIEQLNDAFQTLRDSVNEGTATNDEFNAVIAAAQAASATGISGIDAFISTVEALRGAAIATAGAVAQMNNQISAINNKALNDPKTWRGRGLVGNPAGAMQGSSDPDLPMDGPRPESRPLIELEGLPGQYKADGSLAGRKRGGGGRGANAYKDEVVGIKERTAALRESTAAQAAINPLVSDYGYAMEKAKAEQKLLADAQRAGMAITPQLRDDISALAGAYATASAEAKKLAADQAEVKRQAEAFASMEKDVFKGFLSDLKAGKSGAEALSNALNKVADKLMDMAVDGLFSSLGAGGGGGTGIFGSIISGIGSFLGFGFAKGTANTGGQRGEPRGVVHGQEAVIPLSSRGKVPVNLRSPTAGTIPLPSGGNVPVSVTAPNISTIQQSSRSVSAGAGSSDTVNIHLTDDSGRMANIADQRIQTAAGTIVKVSVERSVKTVKRNFGSMMSDTQMRGG